MSLLSIYLFVWLRSCVRSGICRFIVAFFLDSLFFCSCDFIVAVLGLLALVTLSSHFVFDAGLTLSRRCLSPSFAAWWMRCCIALLNFLSFFITVYSFIYYLLFFVILMLYVTLFVSLSFIINPFSHRVLLLSQSLYHTFSLYPRAHSHFFIHPINHCHRNVRVNTPFYSPLKLRLPFPPTLHSLPPPLPPLLCRPVTLHHPKYHPSHSPSASPSAGRAASLAAAHDSAKWPKLN